jgi:hypothetical protein
LPDFKQLAANIPIIAHELDATLSAQQRADGFFYVI